MGTPKLSGWHSAEYPSPSYYAKHTDYKSPPTKTKEHVSRSSDRVQVKARRYSATYARGGYGTWERSNGYSSGDTSSGPRRHASMRTPSQGQRTQRIIIDTSDSADDSPSFAYIKPRKPDNAPPKYTNHSRSATATKTTTNPAFYYPQATTSRGEDDSYRKSSGHARKPSASRHTRKPSKASSPLPREATAKDALKHGIPAGYSLKNWDPEEAPVMLLGSVFDANSLGKWIYDWTVFHHGPATPISEVAGDLWLLLIKLAHKMKRADECLPRVADDDDYEMVEDFLESGDRLWARVKKLLKCCEEYMWRAAKKEGKGSPGKGGKTTMGKNSGCEFVDSIFGRDREMEETETLMQGVRLWDMRFDANCEDILRHPRG